MTIERAGAVSRKDVSLTVMGPALRVGDKAPDVAINTDVFGQKHLHILKDTAGKVRLISVIPSLTTSICDAQTRRFNQEAAKLGDRVAVITVSADLPFAQANWCAAAGLDKILIGSDHQDMAFGDAYGTHIKEFRLEQRSVFVVDAEGVIRYVEYVPQIGQHPDYDAALDAVKKLIS
jgi:thiol peroxidase